MEDIKYSIELEVVTPLSVGAGNDNEWTRGIDFVQKDGKVYVIDIQKAVANGIDIDRLTQLFLRSDEEGISQLLGNKIDKVSKFIFKSPVKTTNAIKAFLRTELFDKPVVAVSSLKGSIRSALFNYLRTDEKKNEEVFGNMKDGTDLMRFIRVADIEMPSTVLVNTKIFNLMKDGTHWYGGWKHGGTDREGNSHTDEHFKPTGFNTLYECVAPGKKGLGSIILAGNAFDLMAKNTSSSIAYRDKKKALLASDISSLFQIVNEVTKSYLQKEKAFFAKYPAERSEELIDNIDYLLSMIPDDGSYSLLKMSAGVGFHSITGDWQYKDYCDEPGLWEFGRDAGKKKYKSRKTAEFGGRMQLMGFVKLRKLSKEEFETITDALHHEHQAIAEEILAPVKAREIERLKTIEAEKQQKIEIEKEEKRRNSYQTLLSQARQLYANENYDEAITILNQAALLAVHEVEHSTLLDEYVKAKDISDFRKSQQEADKQRFSQPLSEVIKGKVSAGNLIGTTVKWLRENPFGENELQALIAGAKQLPVNEQKRLMGKRSDLVKAIGQDWTERFFKEIR